MLTSVIEPSPMDSRHSSLSGGAAIAFSISPTSTLKCSASRANNSRFLGSVAMSRINSLSAI